MAESFLLNVIKYNHVKYRCKTHYINITKKVNSIFQYYI